MMRYLAIVLVLVLIGTILLVPVSQAQEQDELVALQVIARLNQWRLDEGVPPLKPNATLTAMALEQAQYVAGLEDFPPDDFHIGQRGLNPRNRALAEPFNWPNFGRSDRVAIGENAAQGSVDSAIDFWEGSAPHRSASLNPEYREVGVAAIPNSGAHLIFVVFGSRPGVLPSLLDPRDETTVYLTNEEYRFANTADAIQTAITYHLFNADGLPLDDTPVAWANSLGLPADAGEALYILLSDGEHQALSAVDLSQDRVILPGYLPQAEIESPVDALEPTPVPTEETPDATEALPEATPEATEVPPEPTAVPVSADLRLEYSSDTLDIINVSGAPADWTGLVLSGAITFPFTQFASVVDMPLDALPANHCVQIRDGSLSGAVVLPEGCGWVRSLIQVNATRLFWNQPFQVLQKGATLATCEPSAGVCEVALD